MKRITASELKQYGEVAYIKIIIYAGLWREDNPLKHPTTELAKYTDGESVEIAVHNGSHHHGTLAAEILGVPYKVVEIH